MQPSSPTPRPIGTVVAVQSEGDGDSSTTLSTQTAGGAVRVVIPSLADTAAARRFLGTVRRVDRVQIEVGANDTRAQARGRRHRLPFSSPVPLALALGLAALGVPTSITRKAL